LHQYTGAGNPFIQVGDVADGVAIDTDYDVARFQALSCRGRTRNDMGDDQTV
jgi:hypothetical protein